MSLPLRRRGSGSSSLRCPCPGPSLRACVQVKRKTMNGKSILNGTLLKKHCASGMNESKSPALEKADSETLLEIDFEGLSGNLNINFLNVENCTCLCIVVSYSVNPPLTSDIAPRPRMIIQSKSDYVDLT